MTRNTREMKVDVGVASFGLPDRSMTIAGVDVDVDSIHTWLPEDVLTDLGIARERIDEFVTSNGETVERSVGFAVISVADRDAPCLVVFAGPTDRLRLGWHSLSGLNLRLDESRGQLGPGGPLPAAAAA